ncbi:tetratricopeptide repeat protein [candidate division WOR-3 bacterium]|nr:tetratricopeptide repeat protein [candidate division WOR-3 bacterium]
MRRKVVQWSSGPVVKWLGILLIASRILQVAVASPADLFGRGNAAYEAGDYQQAVTLYDSAIAGATSAELFFNRGNAYFKLGEIGRAIADYNRAYVLKPHDPDIRHNLAFARQYRPDKSTAIENPLLRMLTAFLRIPDAGSARLLAGLFFFLALGSLALLFIRGQRSFGWTAVGLGVLFLYCFVSAASWGEVTSSARAVVVQPELTLRSGPGPDYKDIAVVHDGLEVLVRERRPDYVLIQIPGGDGGWVESASVETIFPSR